MAHTTRTPGISPGPGVSCATLTPAGGLPGLWNFRPQKIMRSSYHSLLPKALQRCVGASCIKPISLGCPGCFFQKERIPLLLKDPKQWLSRASLAG